MAYVKTLLTATLRNQIRNQARTVRRLSKFGLHCDFCAEFEPSYVYRATRMSTGEDRPCWRWCACVRCSRLIDDDNWDSMLEVIASRVATMPGLGSIPLEAIRTAVRTMMKDFQQFAVYNDREKGELS